VNKRVKKKWLKALRSGEYVQGRGALCQVGGDYDTFCYLGVLTDLYLLEKGEGWDARPGEGYLRFGDWYAALPPSVSEWAGLATSDPQLGAASGTAWNDRMGASFSKIADMIEEEL